MRDAVQIAPPRFSDMHQAISDRENDIAVACHRYGVVQLAVFGSAARGVDFDTARSDADLLVRFGTPHGRDPYLDFKAELEKVLERRVDLVDIQAVGESRNYIRRSAILRDAEIVYEAR